MSNDTFRKPAAPLRSVIGQTVYATSVDGACDIRGMRERESMGLADVVILDHPGMDESRSKPHVFHSPCLEPESSWTSGTFTGLTKAAVSPFQNNKG